MPDTTVEPFIRVTGEDVAPAVFRSDWMPDLDLFPELTQLREEHHRIKAAWDEKGAVRQEISERIEAEKERRATALRDAVLAGEPSPEQADADDPALKTELEQANRHCQAAAEAFLEHINHCIATIVSLQPGWDNTLQAIKAGTEIEVQDLMQRLAATQVRGRAFERLRYWLYRTGVEAAELPMVHHTYGALKNYPPPPPGSAEDAKLDIEFAMRSYKGGPGPGATLISNEESVRREQQELHGGEPTISDADLSEMRA